MTDKANDPQLGDVLRQLCAREPILHRREYGTSRAELERITDEAFWEIGASGNTYQRSYVIDKLLERYAQETMRPRVGAEFLRRGPATCTRSGNRRSALFALRSAQRTGETSHRAADNANNRLTPR